jgi:hypothetical protein
MSGEIVLAHAIWQVLIHGSSYVPTQVGVYGASESGKTTLDMQMTTRGEIRPLGEEDRTHHRKNWLGREKMPTITRKRVKSDGMKGRVVISRDLGGHTEYHGMWLRDMIQRKVKTVVVVIDDRHLRNDQNVDNQVALGFLVDALSKNTVPKGLSIRARLRAKKYAPSRIILLANKADEWMSDEDYLLWQKGIIARHKIFDVFRNDLYRLQKMHIPVHMDAMSARYAWNVEGSILKGIHI